MSTIKLLVEKGELKGQTEEEGGENKERRWEEREQEKI